MIEVQPFSQNLSETWDVFVNSAENGTFLHTRRFLSYHGTRFDDVSLMIHRKGTLVGVFPAAIAPFNKQIVVSHPGSTFGGVIHQGGLHGERMIDSLRAIQKYYRFNGFTSIMYKALPFFYSTRPSQDDVYALTILNASVVKRDLSLTLLTSNPRALSERRKRASRKFEGNVEWQSVITSQVWGVVEENLGRRYGVKPVHSLMEIRNLMELFPESIRVLTASLSNEVVGVVVLFNNQNVWHAQYTASTDVGRALHALDQIFIFAISEAKKAGVRYFDFGISTEEQGRHLNSSLYQFKHEFGGGGTIFETFELKID